MDPVTGSIIAAGLSTLISGLLGYGMILLNAYVKSKTKNESIIAATALVGDIVKSTVKSLEQTLVPKYKELSADGKLSKEERKALQNIAMSRIKAQIPEATQKVMALAVESLDKYLADKVEESVYNLK
jgi:hypothetical protein